MNGVLNVVSKPSHAQVGHIIICKVTTDYFAFNLSLLSKKMHNHIKGKGEVIPVLH
jgi:hypothetical protein